MPTARAHLLVAGRVQGVGFRWAIQRVAAEAGLVGWVRNRRDGRVEAVVEGDAAAVQRVVDWCRRGPPGARVDDAAVTWHTPAGDLRSFEIVPSA